MTTEFNEGQSKCKHCNNDRRSWLRFVKVQDCSTDVDDLETKDPAGFKALQKTFAKYRKTVTKAGTQHSFQIMEFVKSDMPPQGPGRRRWVR